MVSASAQDALGQISDPELLARGRVNLISLEAVQARFAARWTQRKDQVCSFAERLLERSLRGSGFSLRISDTDFFVVQPDLGRLAGQAACLGYLREILTHFLGDGSMAAAGVMQVTRIVDGHLEVDRVHAGTAESSEEIGKPDEPAASGLLGASDIEAVPKPNPPNPEAGVAGPVNAWTPFISNDGRKLRVSAVLEPVYELKGFTRIGFRMIRRVIEIRTGQDLTPHEVSLLSSGDQLKIDMATITRGIDRLRAESGGEQQLSLIVPISFISLSSQRGRAELVGPLKEAGSFVKLGVICEICDVEGVPQGPLQAAASLVKPFSLLVVARINVPSPHVLNGLKDAGLQAISFECPPGMEDAEFIGWATAAIRASKAVARSVLVYKAASAARAGALASMGASHVSLAST